MVSVRYLTMIDFARVLDPISFRSTLNDNHTKLNVVD